VPFGPAGRARARGSADSESAETLPPTALDFWGEDSAALHDAMQAPPSDDRPHARRDRSSGRGIPRWSASWRHGRVRPWLRRGVPVAALAVIAIAVIATDSPSLAGRHETALAARRSAPAGETGLTNVKRSAAARTAHLAAARQSATTRPTGDHGRGRHARAPVHRQRKATQSAGARRAPGQPVQSAPPAYTPVSSPTPIQSPSSEPTESSSAGQSSAPSGPVGQGAPFGPGRLG
jgi:hypothetical protein